VPLTRAADLISVPGMFARQRPAPVVAKALGPLGRVGLPGRALYPVSVVLP
jgi:hypothetical protein